MPRTACSSEESNPSQLRDHAVHRHPSPSLLPRPVACLILSLFPRLWACQLGHWPPSARRHDNHSLPSATRPVHCICSPQQPQLPVTNLSRPSIPFCLSHILLTLPIPDHICRSPTQPPPSAEHGTAAVSAFGTCVGRFRGPALERTVVSGCDLVPDGAEHSQSILPQTFEVRTTTVLCPCRSFFGGMWLATARPVAGLLDFSPQAVLIMRQASEEEGPSSIRSPRS